MLYVPKDCKSVLLRVKIKSIQNYDNWITELFLCFSENNKLKKHARVLPGHDRCLGKLTTVNYLMTLTVSKAATGSPFTLVKR